MQFSDLQEFLYQARYSLLALVIFAWVAVIFGQEWLRDRALRRDREAAPATGLGVFDDPLLGPTMADGGEKEERLPNGPTD